MSSTAPSPAGADHDHQHCIDQAVALAGEICQNRGVRLTPLRRRVLELVWKSHGPVGAYAILDWLRTEDGRSAAPPTVYRALEFLIEQRLIHRIESMNAFVGCIDPSRPHAAQYLICRKCGVVTELEDQSITGAIAQQARQRGFVVHDQTVEVHGLCGHCAASAAATRPAASALPA
ncbi:MAG: transcriptional repressor [Alphaproteobacteria bacterium]|nr:transcriptional repressor [Alphaproteobacteria bacterium]